MHKLITFKKGQNKLLFCQNTGSLIGIEKGERKFRFSQAMIWQISLRDTDKKQVVINNRSSADFKYDITGASIRLSWKLKGDYKGLTVIVTATLKNALSYWDIDIENDTPYAIWEVFFPYIKGLGKISKKFDRDYVALPCQWGHLVKDPIDFISQEDGSKIRFWDGIERKPHHLAFEYPGIYSMQFLAYGSPGIKGLYLGAHDGKAYYKRFGLYGESSCTKVDYILKNYPEEMQIPGKGYKLPYEVVVEIFNGQWWQASNIYREWAIKQKWCSKGRISEREDIPDWVKETGLWYWNWRYWKAKGEPKDIVPVLIDLRKGMEVPIAFHWYGWDDKPADTTYPDFSLTQRAKTRLNKALHKLHRKNIKVIPYMNGRLWNIDNQCWQKEKASAYACRQEGINKEDVGYYIEPYRNRPFALMCPYTKFWQDKVITNVKEILDHGVDGVYIDQVSSAHAVLCFAPNHGHKVGGNYWYKGYCNMMEHLRKETRGKYPEAAFTSESVIECFIGVFDAFLGYQCASFTDKYGKGSYTIPLFTSVYYGYIPLYATGCTIEKEQEYYLGMAWDIVGGVQPSLQGYFAKHIHNKKYQSRLKYLEQWVKKYSQVREDLLVAEWQPLEKIRINKAVLTSLLKTRDRKELILWAVNHTQKPRKLEFSIDPGRYQMEGLYNLLEIDNNKTKVIMENKKCLKVDMLLKERSVNLFKIVPAHKTS